MPFSAYSRIRIPGVPVTGSVTCDGAAARGLVDLHAVQDLDVVADPLAEAVGDADLVRGADLGGPATHAGGLEGMPTDEGDLGVVGERERAVVGEHGHA